MGKDLNFNEITVRVGRVKSKKNTKWRALRLECRGIGRIQLATHLRHYFDGSDVNEDIVRTQQPNGAGLFGAPCTDYLGAGTMRDLHDELPRLVADYKKKQE